MIKLADYIQCTGELFEAVQTQGIFPDSKTFVDCTPRIDPNHIQQRYQEQLPQGAALRDFVLRYFELPPDASKITLTPTHDIKQHIRELMPSLERQDSQHPGDSLIPLPKPYLIPGGRFRELYYWDSFFTCLCVDSPIMLDNMAQNFAYLIDHVGHIPNANRVYYASRSQAPFFACLVDLLEQRLGIDNAVRFLPALEKEWHFWMQPERMITLNAQHSLNRYWDNSPTPRPESYREDTELAKNVPPQKRADLYRHIRAACESGWDFSSRWLQDPHDLTTIQTTDLIPVDLNCLLYFLEKKCAHLYAHINQHKAAAQFETHAQQRLAAIADFLWSDQEQFFMDYHWQQQCHTPHLTLASVYPLYFQLCTPMQAQHMANKLQQSFLQSGGLCTTLITTEQQWDKPNGWAPLQWLAIKGLEQYGFTELANTISSRWLSLNREVFAREHKFYEKYNVCQPLAIACGGEYPCQDGFGWTNSIVMQLLERASTSETAVDSLSLNR